MKNLLLGAVLCALLGCSAGPKLLIDSEAPGAGAAAVLLRIDCYHCESGAGYPGGEQSYLRLVRSEDGRKIDLPLKGSGLLYAALPPGRYALAKFVTPDIEAVFPGVSIYDRIISKRVYGFEITEHDSEVYLGYLRICRSYGECLRNEKALDSKNILSEIEKELFTSPAEAVKKIERANGGDMKLHSFDLRSAPAAGYSDIAFFSFNALPATLTILKNAELYRANDRLPGMLPEDFALQIIDEIEVETK